MKRNHKNYNTNIREKNIEATDRTDGDEKMVHCPSCGAVYDIDLVKCPYCGATNPAGAERAYMDRLHGIRRDLHGLNRVSAEETRRELRETGSVLKKALFLVVLILLAMILFVKISDIRSARETKEDYLWEKEAFQTMDAYYEQGDYEALLQMYYEALQQERPVYRWEHVDLCEILVIMEEADELFSLEEESSLEGDRLLNLLWCELSLKWSGSRGFSEEEQAWLSERIAPYLADLAERFPMTEEEEQIFENNAKAQEGYISLELCEQYLKNHPEVGYEM